MGEAKPDNIDDIELSQLLMVDPIGGFCWTINGLSEHPSSR
jgi:hypothetical protein